MIVLKSILVATDFTEPSANALAYGSDLARSYGATLHLLHVTENIVMSVSPEVGVSIPDFQIDLERKAKESLEKLIIAHELQSLEVVPVVESATSAAAAIVDYAKLKHIDLIIVGTHGRRGFQHLLVGSVAERVVRTAPCPVLAVRAVEHEFIAPDPGHAHLHASH